ncbi:response regulator [Marinicellulosiphila megalodicopiae]|uniref:response regulator n=1 Tax=Marinicellulosiphila megalodicopiae TaxID=2724896 RepID=UPI003BAF1FF8
MKVRLLALITFFVLLIQSSILLLFIFINYERYNKEINEQTKDKILNIQNRLSSTLPLLLWNYNSEAILENLNIEIKNNLLLGIFIEYEGKTEYQVANTQRLNELNLNAQQFLLKDNATAPVELTFSNRDISEKVGNLYLVVDHSILERKKREAFNIQIFQFILIDIVLFISISLLLYQLVIKPIQKTVNGLKGIVTNNDVLSKKLPAHYIYELNELSNYFNQLNDYVVKMLNELHIKSDNIEAIFNNTKNALLLIDSHGVVQSANLAVSTLFKKDLKSAINSDIQKIINDERISNFIKNPIKQKNNLNFEIDLSKNGNLLYIAISISKIKQAHDQAFILFIQDVTEQHILYHDLEVALEKEQETTKLKSEFLASMSHEIRTPMNGVIGMLDLLAKTELNSQQIHYNSIAQTSAESLLVIINDILDFSKIEAGKLEIENVEFDILKMTGELAQTMAIHAQEKGLDVWLDSTNFDIAIVLGDPGRIRQILTNLINNATKFTQTGDILISINPYLIENQSLIFSCTIKDSGIGIEKHKKETLFESFSQVDSSTTRKFGGTGLGLSIVKQLCNLMGGDVNVNSEPNLGSEFTFTIKLGIPENQSQIQQALPRPNNKFKNIKIVIIENNKLGEFILSRLLSKISIRPECIEYNEHSIEKITELTPDFLIMDTSTTGNQTEEISKNIIRNLPNLKIVLLSKIYQLSNSTDYKKMGIHAEIGKPIIFEELLMSLEETPTHHHDIQESKKINIHENNKSSIEHSQLEITNKRTINKVLLVEDNWVNQEIAIALLESFNLTVEIANNGIEALALLKNQKKRTGYKLIFMDCLMPEMDGYETTIAIRKGQANTELTPNNRTLPIIAMTANAMKGDREKCIGVGMDDYISKPINEEELLSKVNKWLI